jgi:hypothetical protein
MTAVELNGGIMRAIAMAFGVAAGLAPCAAAAAPSQLYGKSVTVNWSETRSQRAVGQEPAFHPVSIPFTLTVYVSSEGHIFRRLSSITPNGRQSGAKDRVGESSSGANSSFAAQFRGNAMVASGSNGGFGLHVEVTFDSSFGGCTAQVIAAKQSGSRTVMLRSIASGATIEVESASAGSASCSVAQGNPFAN